MLMASVVLGWGSIHTIQRRSAIISLIDHKRPEEGSLMWRTASAMAVHKSIKKVGALDHGVTTPRHLPRESSFRVLIMSAPSPMATTWSMVVQSMPSNIPKASVLIEIFDVVCNYEPNSAR
jgi:hypothetical protein